MVSANSVGGGGRNSLVKWGKFLVVAALVLSSGFFVPSAGATVSSIDSVVPNGGELVRGNTNVTWTGTALPEDLVDIGYSPDFSHFTILTAGGVPFSPSLYSWNTIGIPDGSNYQVKVKAELGIAERISASSFTIDNTPPVTTATVNPVVPNGDNGWYKTAPTISLACADNLSGCNQTFYKWDDGSFLPYSETLTAPEGVHILYFYSEDNAIDNTGTHNAELHKTLNVKVDTHAPTVAGYTLDGGTTPVAFNPAHHSVAVSITANEPVNWTFAKIYKSDNLAVYKDKDPSGDGTSTGAFTWDGTPSPEGSLPVDGTYKVKVHIKDLAGNDAGFIELAPTPIMTVDTVNPTITVPTSPVAETVYKSDPALTFTATDPIPGTTVSCTYQIDSGSPVSVPCTGTDRTISGLFDGRHSVVVTATDQANNVTNSSAVSFVYNNDHALTVCKTGTPDFATISAAVTAATAGDTISICADTYSESVLVGKQLALLGSGVKPVITGSVGNDYILKVNGANGVMLDNLEINGGGTNNFDYGILVNGSGTSSSPVEIRNSTVKNVWRNGSNGIGVENSSYVLAHHNAISSFHKRGIRFINSNGKFYNNDVRGDSVDGTTRVQNLVNLWSGSIVEIYNNTLHDAKSLPGTPTWDSPGIFISSYGGSGDSHADIHDNEIYNGDSGIVVGSYYATTDNSTATITNNNLHNLNWAINFEKGTVSATITGNKFSTVNRAVSADNSHGGPAIKPSVNAERNWWGTAYRPTITGLVYSAVDFDPYWVNEAMTILSDTPLLTAYVDDDFGETNNGGHVAYGYDAFSKVQEGIDKVATSGTVNVVAGTYVENVTIGTAGVALRAVTKHEAVIRGTVVITANDVAVDGFSINNFSQIPTPDLSGVYIPSGTGIKVANNLIDGTGIDPVAHLTVGIHTLYGGTAGATLEGNIVRNVRLGIYNQGALLLISKNTIENTAHCAIGVDTSLGTTITENTISNTLLGVEVFKDNVIANHNNITGTTGFGVWSAGPQVDAKTNWWGAISGPTHSSNPGGSGGAVSDDVDYSPWCTDEDCEDALGSSDPLHHYEITASPDDSAVTPGPITLAIVAKDADDITRVNDNSQFTLTANRPVSFEPDYILNLVNGVENADVSYSGVGDVSIHVTGTVTSIKLLTFTALPDTSDQIAPPIPVITTLPATVNADFYTINGTAGADLLTDSSRTIRLFNGDVLAGTTILSVGQTAWSVVVSLNQEATNVFKATSTDASGHVSDESNTVTITEHFNDTAPLAVTGISTTQSLATADNSWEHGWHWTFNVTVPTVESSLSMQFSDWTGSAGVIPVAGNTRFYSAQSDHNATSPVVIMSANTYTGPIQLTGDLDPATPGRQIQIMVETKVPERSAGGSYSASYGVRTSMP